MIHRKDPSQSMCRHFDICWFVIIVFHVGATANSVLVTLNPFKTVTCYCKKIQQLDFSVFNYRPNVLFKVKIPFPFIKKCMD